MSEAPVHEAYRMAQEGALVIDVREPFEYASGHVPDSELVPLGQLPHRHSELPRNRRILTMCQSGNRSGQAAMALSRLGYDVVNIRGGMLDWTSAGLPVATA